jgi:S-DNA-T family DNA segregation ATPase FtsK/SpoIIIE
MQEINNINFILNEFKINAHCVNYQSINNYLFYDLKLNSTTKVKDIRNIVDEISLALQAPCKPAIKILHEQGVVRLEFISSKLKKINLLNSILSNVRPQGELMCLLGNKVDGDPLWMDLSKNPHMIVAGTTGSGKSILLHNIIANILYFNNAQIFLIDPKNVEFLGYQNLFENIRVYNDYTSCLQTIEFLIELMEIRYNFLRNGATPNLQPQILIIDEFADLIMQDKDNELYLSLCRLAQKCRAANIYIILATQRPSADIINGSIKANFPARISCRVTSNTESKIILDSVGAENLFGLGDALIKDSSRNLERFQIAYTDSKEIFNFFGKNDYRK